jgi:hypothetical protein
MYGKPWESAECKPCSVTDGAKCDLNSSIPFVLSGYWRTGSAAGNIFECIPHEACNFTGLNSETMCSEGYTGARCGDCLQDTYFHYDSYCKKCGDMTISISSIFAVFVLFILLAISLVADRSRSAKRIDLMVMISSLQFLALYPRISNNWPPRIKSLLDALSVSVRLYTFHCELIEFVRTSTLIFCTQIVYCEIIFGPST